MKASLTVFGPCGPSICDAWPMLMAGMAVGQQVDALVAGRDQRLNVLVGCQPRTAVSCCIASPPKGAEPESTDVFQWATPLASTLKSSVASPWSV